MPLIQDNVGELLEAVQVYLAAELALLVDAMVNGVSLGNPGRLVPPPPTHTIITLLRTEEDASRKAQRNYRVTPSPDGNPPGIEKRNPAVVLNLYVLISANHTDYSSALKVLGDIVAIFQHRPILDDTVLAGLSVDGVYATRRLKFSLLSPNLEDWNHIWGMLGGHHLPALLYLVQSAEVEMIPDQSDPGSPITEIQLTETIN